MNENEKKSNKVLVIILIIVLMIAFAGLGYFFGKDQSQKNTIKYLSESKNDTKKEEKETETIDTNETNIKKGECPLTKFSTEYVFTEDEMDEIQETIETEMKKSGAPSFELKDLSIKNQNYDYLISVRYDIENNPGSGPLSAILFKVNQQYKIYLYGTETTTDKLEELNNTLTKICS